MNSLLLPVRGRVGDRFGWRRHPILGETLFHTGVDIRADFGQPIRASQDGRVIFAGWLRGYGRTLVVRHSDGFTTRYAHCSRLLKRVGDRVRRGARIARVGSSGLSTGPHVHFEVRQFGKPLNPLRHLSRGGRRRS
jgi:murein DD-endopeptidase MepM/ murein hydrolase activator NlpD